MEKDTQYKAGGRVAGVNFHPALKSLIDPPLRELQKASPPSEKSLTEKAKEVFSKGGKSGELNHTHELYPHDIRGAGNR